MSPIAKMTAEGRKLTQALKAVPLYEALMLQTILRKRCTAVSVRSRLLKRRIWIRPYTSDMNVLTKVLGFQDYGLADDRIDPKVIVDGGANIGLSSLYFSWKYPSAKIFAIEPEESNLEILRRNCANLASIQVIPAALWSKPCKLSLSNPDRPQWHKWTFSVCEGPSEKKVNSVTMTDILSAAKSDCIDILKLDVEGAERELFREGCADWLPRVRIILIELHDRLVPGCSENFYSAIVGRPFEQELKGENVIIRFRNGT